MTVTCSYQACAAVIAAETPRALTDALWHHLVGTHHPDLYAKLGFPR